jgi:hypothetical protein
VTLACAGAAVASAPRPITLAKSLEAGAPTILVDSRGTINALWTATHDDIPTVRYAREPAGAKHFTQVKLPGMPSTNGKPFIFEPSHGVLEVIVTVNGTEDLQAWRSTNDGASWKALPTTPLETWEADGFTLQASYLFPAPGGPLTFSGSTGATGAVVQLDPAISKATTLGTNTNAITIEGLARSGQGTVFQLGAPAVTTTTVFPFQAGTHTGELEFPCGSTTSFGGTSYKLAAGHSLAVAAFAGCGHIWTRTIAPSGTVGALVNIAAGPGANTSGEGTNGTAWVGLVAAHNGKFTAAYTVPGDDIGVAHSANGSSWKSAAGLVPAQGVDSVYGEASRSLSEGVGTWFGVSPQTPSQGYEMQLLPLSKTYRPPAAPSAAGISSPRRGHLGSLAVTAPGAIVKQGFEKTAKVTAKLVDAIGGKVTATIAINYVKGTTTYEVCSGDGVAKLSPGRAATVSIPCASGAVTLGATVSDIPVVKKGYLVTFTFTGRNGSITLKSKIS